jgi:hypothetical protein
MHTASPFQLKSHCLAAWSNPREMERGMGTTSVPQMIHIAAEIWYLKMTKSGLHRLRSASSTQSKHEMECGATFEVIF